MILNTLLAIKMLNKLDLYAYSFQKWVDIEEVLRKLYVCFYFIKHEEFLGKYNEIWEKVERIIKKEFHSEPVHNKDRSKSWKKNLFMKK